jgi:hypothetical protein
VSSIVTAATGQPYNANIGTSILGSAIAGDGGMTGAEVSTFAGPTGGRVSWLARNAFNLPNFTDVDFRLGRAFSFREKYRLNFIVDAFNLFNSTIVSSVNTTAYTYSVQATTGTSLPSAAARRPLACCTARASCSSALVSASEEIRVLVLRPNARRIVSAAS